MRTNYRVRKNHCFDLFDFDYFFLKVNPIFPSIGRKTNVNKKPFILLMKQIFLCAATVTVLKKQAVNRKHCSM